MQVQKEAFRGPQVVQFLRHLLRHIKGKLLVVWDGSSIHRSKVVKEFLSSKPGHRVWLERLPGYAPDLNPVEGIWHYLKRVRLGNVCCRTLKQLQYEVRLATVTLRHKTRVLANLPRHYGCPL
jgi:putative transposase